MNRKSIEELKHGLPVTKVKSLQTDRDGMIYEAKLFKSGRVMLWGVKTMDAL